MRLGLLGPAKRNLPLLRQRAEFVLSTLKAERAVYLGIDDALDEVVSQWALELVKGDPSDAAVWARAAQLCAKGGSSEIGAFLDAERSRQALKALECLPQANARNVELFGTVVAVLIHDKALLTEEDMLPASILVFGRSSEPIIHRIGQRCFVCPGPLTHDKGGVALLTDGEDGSVTGVIYGADGTCTMSEVVAQTGRGARMIVQGGS
jgi:hypothetical protein